jgi:membrane protein DedA with SNARE-associated domain
VEPARWYDRSAATVSGLTTPPTNPSRRRLTLIVAPIIVLVAIGTAANAVHPALIKDHPLWLIAADPRSRWVLLVADKVSFWPLFVLATGRRLLSDPLFFLLGHLYGDRAVRWAERRFDSGTGAIRWIERVFQRAAPLLVFFFPGALVCTLAGATGMNLAVFAALNVLGTMVMVVALYEFAGLVRGPIDAINRFYSHNFKWLTAVSVVLTLAWVANQWRRGRSEVQALASLDELEGEAADPADAS